MREKHVIEVTQITCIKQVPDISGCFIYMWSRKGQLLYIGSTTKLGVRFKTGHKVINKETFSAGDIIYAFKIPDNNENILRYAEQILIEKLYPPYNTMHNSWYGFVPPKREKLDGILWRALKMARTKNIERVESTLERLGVDIEKSKDTLLSGKAGFYVTFHDINAVKYVIKLKTALYSWLHILNVNQEYSIKSNNTTVEVTKKPTADKVIFSRISED